ncbi:Hypothetical_protein [Hexamita inflata]|uniref:Hypothetical_protein n=2 Tax=Hexamita inflata TaxID=28002 RepID=A0ABP1J6N8_9EUKA
MTCHLQVQRISDYDQDMKAVRLTTAVQALLWILRDILQQDTILITQKTLCHFQLQIQGTTSKIEQHQSQKGRQFYLNSACISQNGSLFKRLLKLNWILHLSVHVFVRMNSGFSVALLGIWLHLVFASYFKNIQTPKIKPNHTALYCLRQCIWLSQKFHKAGSPNVHKAHYISVQILRFQSRVNRTYLVTYTTEVTAIIYIYNSGDTPRSQPSQILCIFQQPHI